MTCHRSSGISRNRTKYRRIISSFHKSLRKSPIWPEIPIVANEPGLLCSSTAKLSNCAHKTSHDVSRTVSINFDIGWVCEGTIITNPRINKIEMKILFTISSQHWPYEWRHQQVVPVCTSLKPTSRKDHFIAVIARLSTACTSCTSVPVMLHTLFRVPTCPRLVPGLFGTR